MNVLGGTGHRALSRSRAGMQVRHARTRPSRRPSAAATPKDSAGSLSQSETLSTVTNEYAVPYGVPSPTVTSRPCLTTFRSVYNLSVSLGTSLATSETDQTMTCWSSRSVRSLLMLAPNWSPISLSRLAGRLKPSEVSVRDLASWLP